MPSKVKWCSNCLNMSTRKRITFDERGWCNACQWMEEKQTLAWSQRESELLRLLEKNRANSVNFDCIVPVSGGKDGSYVAYMLKEKYKMNPLAVTVRPAMSLPIGNHNLSNFIDSGFNHVQISPNAHLMQQLNKQGFIEKGFPYFGWLTAIITAVIRTAINFNIPLIFYGEDGEVEYGGSCETKYTALYDIGYMQRVYLEGGYNKVLDQVREQGGFSQADMLFFQFPTEEQVKTTNLQFTHWSYFEAWDSYRNYMVAKKHCALIEQDENNSGTFTNFAQNDQALYALHAYMMYLKFGFGRATQDAGIEIRRGAMTRAQGLNLVKMYDNAYPEAQIPSYLEYYKMSREEFEATLDRHVNRSLFEKTNGRWQPKFVPGESFILEDAYIA